MRLRRVVAGLLISVAAWIAATVWFESYIHSHRTRSWETAITATSTIALVVVTAVYVGLTRDLVRNSDPKRVHRAATQEEAARELLRYMGRNNDVLREMAARLQLAADFDFVDISPTTWKEAKVQLSEIEDQLEIFGILLPAGVAEACDGERAAIATLSRHLYMDLTRIDDFLRERPARAQSAAAARAAEILTERDPDLAPPTGARRRRAFEEARNEDALRAQFAREYLEEPPSYAELREWAQALDDLKLYVVGAEAAVVERPQQNWLALRTRLIEYLRNMSS